MLAAVYSNLCTWAARGCLIPNCIAAQSFTVRREGSAALTPTRVRFGGAVGAAQARWCPIPVWTNADLFVNNVAVDACVFVKSVVRLLSTFPALIALARLAESLRRGRTRAAFDIPAAHALNVFHSLADEVRSAQKAIIGMVLYSCRDRHEIWRGLVELL